MTYIPYIAVIGGSYVGTNTAKQLATRFHGQFRVVLIEKNSHFQHLFAFPRFAVATNVDTHKAFIPYSPGTFAECPAGSGVVVQAAVTGLNKTSIQLDRKVSLFGQDVDSVPYAFMVIATGTKLTAPSTLPGSEKLNGTTYLREHAKQVSESSTIAVIGGGAVGVQMATDIKEIYPEKTVTLVHSRDRLMNRFHQHLDEIIKQRCAELGVNLKLGSRVKLPAQGYPTDGTKFTVDLEDGTSVPADFAIICTGQTPQSDLLKAISPSSIDKQGFIHTAKTLQVVDPEHPNIFAVGDVAATGAHKAAKPGGKQAGIVVENIQHMINGEPLEEYTFTDAPGIHLTLGVAKSVAFGNPVKGSDEPFVKHKDDGRLDMNIDGVWARKGGGPNAYL